MGVKHVEAHEDPMFNFVVCLAVGSLFGVVKPIVNDIECFDEFVDEDGEVGV